MYDTIDVDKVLRHNAALREELEQLRTETGVQELMDKLRKELMRKGGTDADYQSN